jgi:uncharacterized membrane protein
MATLTVWHYPTPLGAKVGAVRVRALQGLEALEVLDAVTITWIPGAHQPRLSQGHHLLASRTPDRSVLAALVRELAVVRATGDRDAAVTAVAERLAGTGVDAPLLDEIIEHLSPGASMLMVLSGWMDLDVVRPAVERGLAREGVTLLYAELPSDAMVVLRSVLVDEVPEQDH